MPATPELFKRAIAASVREFETLSSQETDPMEAYHHANYELSALLCVLSEQVDDEVVVDAVGEIIEQYEEIAERAGVDFSPYEGYEVNDAMSYDQAQTLAVAVVGQGFRWLTSEEYDAFLRREVFGGGKQSVTIVSAKSPHEGFAVLAKWDAMDKEFNTPQEWQEFVSEIEDRVKAVALDFEDSEDIEE